MRRCLISLLALGALAAVSCNADLSPGATVLQAAEETRAEKSARVSYKALFDVDSAPEPVELSGVGLFDYSHKRGRMIFDMAGVLAPSASSDVPGEVEMIVDGPLLYLQMPFLADVLPESRPWIKVDLEAAARSNRTDLAQFTQLGQGDPTQVLDLLRGVTKDVKRVGRERVRGVPTTEYETDLDLARVAQNTPAENQASLSSLLTRSDSKEMQARVWVDDGGRLRRMRYELDLAPGSSGPTQVSPTSMSVTMELFDFGVPVDVTPPAEDHVIDLLGLAE